MDVHLRYHSVLAMGGSFGSRARRNFQGDCCSRRQLLWPPNARKLREVKVILPLNQYARAFSQAVLDISGLRSPTVRLPWKTLSRKPPLAPTDPERTIRSLTAVDFGVQPSLLHHTTTGTPPEPPGPDPTLSGRTWVTLPCMPSQSRVSLLPA